MDDITQYYDNTQKPWGNLFYRIVWEQLLFVKNMKVLDFGSGFGITSNHLAACNDVVAVEPNTAMLDRCLNDNGYKLVNGGIERLYDYQDGYFDIIICHNVLEYIDNKDDYISFFNRLLSVKGKLSLIKHNHYGRIMQKVALENNIQQAIDLLDGKPAFAQYFGEIKYYGNTELYNWINKYRFELLKYMGIRTFYSLYADNSVRYDEKWLDSMYELEIKASTIKELANVATFNHIILEKT